MTILKYQSIIKYAMQILVPEYENQAKPKTQRQVTYFCRLCREYGIKTRKAHLQNHHNANRDTVTKRSNNDLVKVIFVESK
jgi:hypothetical protein